MYELYAPGLQERINTRLKSQTRRWSTAATIAGATAGQPAGERAQIRPAVQRAHGRACRAFKIVLIVADTGPGIAAADREARVTALVRLHDTRLNQLAVAWG
jgi:hypothetical protein